MKQESLWSAIKAGFPVGAVFFGALVGPVMVTGSYTMNYFLCAGVKSWIYFFIYAISIGWFFSMGFEHTRQTALCNPGVDVYSYTVLSKSLYGPKLKFMVPIYNLWVFIAMIITGAATVATGGTLIASFLGTSYIVGAIIMALLNMCIAIFGADIIRKTSTAMTFGIIAMMIVLVIITLATKSKDLVSVMSSGWTPPVGSRSLGSGAWRIFVLTCSSCSWALGLGAVAQHMQSKKSCIAGGASAGLLGAFAFLLMFIIVVPWVGKIYETGTMDPAPVLSITTSWLNMPWLGVIYYALMILALVSSGAPSLYVAADRIRNIIPFTRNAKNKMVALIGCSLLYCAVVITMAAGGLTPIVSKYFQYLGYFGQVCGVIPMAIIWPILRAKGVKPIIPSAKAENSAE